MANHKRRGGQEQDQVLRDRENGLINHKISIIDGPQQITVCIPFKKQRSCPFMHYENHLDHKCALKESRTPAKSE